MSPAPGPTATFSGSAGSTICSCPGPPGRGLRAAARSISWAAWALAILAASTGLALRASMVSRRVTGLAVVLMSLPMPGSFSFCSVAVSSGRLIASCA